MLVSADGFAGAAVDVRQPVQARRRQDAVNRGGGDAETAGEAVLALPAATFAGLTHRFATACEVLLGDDFGRDERSCMGSPDRYLSTQRFTVGRKTWKRAATSLIG